MSPLIITFVALSYFVVLIIISAVTSRKAGNKGFFLGNRKSPWFIVAIGMIGASLSGVTFISVPGWVVDSNFGYMQMVLGYLVGYAIIAEVLMPMYYRLNLTSIYSYLEERFGKTSYKTGAGFFLLSRAIGSSFRLFLVANVLQISIFNAVGVPFWLTVVITVVLIWLYTFRGGIQTIIWTDTLQTLFMITSVIVTIVFIGKEMNLSFGEMVETINISSYSDVFYFDNWSAPNHFIKQFMAGAFIAIVMTGLDQDMMQKNLSCRNIKEAKKNMYWFSFSLIPVNIIFLSLGVLLIMYAQYVGIALPERSDDLYPLIATQGYLPPFITIFFMLGLIAAAYSSADSALTALTTSFTVDILNTKGYSETQLKSTRKKVHVFISMVLVVIILLFRAINDESVISAIFRVAGYTYGPLLGMYSFGLLTKWHVKDRFVPYVAILSPILCFVLNKYSVILFNGYHFGFELLIVNGAITFAGLLLLKKNK